MFYCKRAFKLLILIFSIVVCAVTLMPAAASAEEAQLYLGGFPAGFVLNTTTVEVIGVCDVVTSKPAT